MGGTIGSAGGAIGSGFTSGQYTVRADGSVIITSTGQVIGRYNPANGEISSGGRVIGRVTR